MRVLVAPDKFKGSLTAAAVARSLAEGLAGAGVDSTRLPLADGGDGSVDAAVAAGFSPKACTVADAVGTPRRATMAVRGDTVIVEVADTCGLATLPGGRMRPLDASSLGFGQAIRQALRLSPRRVVLALGGSAGTDGGMGLLTAFGFRFIDQTGRILPPGGRALLDIASIDTSAAVRLPAVDLVLASDVTNPLTGPEGAAAVYGPQKGADPAEVRLLDHGLNHMVEALARNGFPRAPRFAAAPGAGSAGGIGFAAMLLGARTTSGAEFFLDLLDFDRHCARADLVVTGEGSFDAQSEHGKLPAAVARRAKPVPVIAVAGRSEVPRSRWGRTGFADVYALRDYTDRDTARDPALTAELLVRIGREIGHSRLLESAGVR
ncbi:glycerate kinase [Nocardia sp. CS682]|uniref:glycerate kinase n=1 Tax=Nocardia sp. CS682 TaxID=1047172 RepID=UPI0010754E31|nr:glycerate kinase [Nocardia sp. CS682]QBS44974.1 glycerate kinase [Nocardia sp. CS682]